MKTLTLSFAVALSLAASIALANSPSLDNFLQQTDAFLKKNVTEGQVNYQGVKGNFQQIDALYQSIGSIRLSALSAAEKKAFYINAYNLIVIHQVAKNYPLASVKDQYGFFDKKEHNVAGENLTLNELEIKKLLWEHKDPRVHFALACAAVSCPPLASFAYLPAQLDQQLESRTRASLNDAGFIQVNSGAKLVKVSKIFEWYKKDFVAQQPSVLAYINAYRNQKIPAGYQVVFYEYDWTLNDK